MEHAALGALTDPLYRDLSDIQRRFIERRYRQFLNLIDLDRPYKFAKTDLEAAYTSYNTGFKDMNYFAGLPAFGGALLFGFWDHDRWLVLPGCLVIAWASWIWVRNFRWQPRFDAYFEAASDGRYGRKKWWMQQWTDLPSRRLFPTLAGNRTSHSLGTSPSPASAEDANRKLRRSRLWALFFVVVGAGGLVPEILRQKPVGYVLASLLLLFGLWKLVQVSRSRS
jgi:hypothetical protein